MLKKIICAVLVLAALSVVPVLMAGCDKPSYHHSSSYEEQNRPVDQHEVVE
ncbi:MAG: hypothetical protein ACE15C_12600 [Phycisphaerae bacterium]